MKPRLCKCDPDAHVDVSDISSVHQVWLCTAFFCPYPGLTYETEWRWDW